MLLLVVLPHLSKLNLPHLQRRFRVAAFILFILILITIVYYDYRSSALLRPKMVLVKLGVLHVIDPDAQVHLDHLALFFDFFRTDSFVLLRVFLDSDAHLGVLGVLRNLNSRLNE